MLLNQKIFFLSSESVTVYFVASRLLAVTGGNFSGSAAASVQPVSTNYTITVTKPDATTLAPFTITPAANGLASFTIPDFGYEQGVWSWSAVNAVSATASDVAAGVFYWGDATYVALNTNASTAATQATTAATQATAANTSVQAGGYVGTRVNTASTALTTNITTPVPSLTGTPPNVASQVALLYWVLAGLERTFDPVTGRVYLDTTPIAGSLPPGTQVYFQCWADVARTIPATTLAEVLVQDPIAYV